MRDGVILDENDPKYICGRPLGLAFDTIGDNLIVMDTTAGVFELSLKNGQKKQLVSETDVIGVDVRKNFHCFEFFIITDE